MKKLRKEPDFCFAQFLVTLLSLSFAAQAQEGRPRNTIPPATATATAEEKQWWENVRQTGAEAAKALEHKDNAIKSRRSNTFNIPDNEEELLPKKEREKLNTALTSATEKYLGALREGKEKGYRVPLVDGRPVILGMVKARYTNAARAAGVNGVVVVSIAFQADGTVGELKIIRGLDPELDKKAIEAARKIIFLPAVKAASFSTTRGSAEFSFDIY